MSNCLRTFVCEVSRISPAKNISSTWKIRKKLNLYQSIIYNYSQLWLYRSRLERNFLIRYVPFPVALEYIFCVKYFVANAPNPNQTVFTSFELLFGSN